MLLSNKINSSVVKYKYDYKNEEKMMEGTCQIKQQYDLIFQEKAGKFSNYSPQSPFARNKQDCTCMSCLATRFPRAFDIKATEYDDFFTLKLVKTPQQTKMTKQCLMCRKSFCYKNYCSNDIICLCSWQCIEYMFKEVIETEKKICLLQHYKQNVKQILDNSKVRKEIQLEILSFLN